MLKLLDLFSGIGGFSLGLERTGGFETVAFCEIDKFCQKVLRKHWPHVRQYTDVTKLTAAQLTADGITVDAICGGFPCQDISLAGGGAGMGEGTRSGLWSEYARLIGELRPRYVIVENVSALLSRGLDRVLGDLAKIGYDAEWHCIPAAAVGAPHRRDRIWIVAYPNASIRWGGEEREPFWNGGPSLHGEDGQTITDTSRRGDGCNGVRQTVEVLANADSECRGTPRPSCVETAPAIAVCRNRSTTRVVADAQSQPIRPGFRTDEPGREWRGRFSDSSGEIPYPHNTGRKEQRITFSIAEELAAVKLSGGWATEPNVGRVANGISNRAHRLKSLGNAVVPQIPELIGRAILSAEAASPQEE